MERVRRFSPVETNSMFTSVRWTRTQLKYLKHQTWLERKSKSETFEYLATEYGSLKSIALIFHDRDLTSRSYKGKRLHCRYDLISRNPRQIDTLEKFKFEAEIFEQIKIWCSVLKHKGKSSSGSYRYF